ncbi:ion transporter [Parasedimentitalea marina]|uniref:ion transporter n=1 Tax=Parasedimentitalea marina TaxID=2483033 RepID=UPI00237BF56D|nr:ion transporter [Parasedimentitalea marina]
MLVVSVGVLPDKQGLSALRGLRVLRALRLLSVVPQMRAVVQALLDALPGMGAVIVMLSIVYYVFAVMATLMYGAAFDEWFGTLGRSLYSLFQIMTLESWSMGIVRPVMLVYPMAWIFCALYCDHGVLGAEPVHRFAGQYHADRCGGRRRGNEKLRELVRTETDIVDAHVIELREEIRSLRAELLAARGESNGG